MGNIPSIQAGISSSDEKQQKAELLDNELKQAGFSNSKIDQMIADANDVIGCGPECQRERRINELQREVNEAKLQIQNAPSDLRRAEQELITFQNGSAAYTEEMRRRYEKEGAAFVKERVLQHETIVRDANTIIDELDTSETYMDNARELLDVKIGKNKLLKSEIDTNTGIVRTNNRRGQYRDEQIDTYSRYQLWTTVLYYVLLVAVIVRLFTKGHSKNKGKWALIALFAVIPFLLRWIYLLIIQVGGIVKGMI